MLLFNDEGKISTLVQFDMQVSSWSELVSPPGCAHAHTLRQHTGCSMLSSNATMLLSAMLLQDYSRLLRDNAPVGSK